MNRLYYATLTLLTKGDMSYNLFLDDLRNPEAAFLYDRRCSLFEASHQTIWHVVRSYKEFVECIRRSGIPERVSFDHDLHFEHLTDNYDHIDYSKYVNKTGKECAEFLVKCVQEQNAIMPIYYIHSANIVGRKNIAQVLRQ
jgi:hypothetical protein